MGCVRYDIAKIFKAILFLLLEIIISYLFSWLPHKWHLVFSLFIPFCSFRSLLLINGNRYKEIMGMIVWNSPFLCTLCYALSFSPCEMPCSKWRLSILSIFWCYTIMFVFSALLHLACISPDSHLVTYQWLDVTIVPSYSLNTLFMYISREMQMCSVCSLYLYIK